MQDEQYQSTFLHLMADSGMFSHSGWKYSLQMLHCTITWNFLGRSLWNPKSGIRHTQKRGMEICFFGLQFERVRSPLVGKGMIAPSEMHFIRWERICDPSNLNSDGLNENAKAVANAMAYNPQLPLSFWLSHYPLYPLFLSLYFFKIW